MRMDKCDLCLKEAVWHLGIDQSPKFCDYHFGKMMEEVRFWVAGEKLKRMVEARWTLGKYAGA
mgnify:CR=1 FL=1